MGFVNFGNLGDKGADLFAQSCILTRSEKYKTIRDISLQNQYDNLGESNNFLTPPPAPPLKNGRGDIAENAGLRPNPHLLFASKKVSKKRFDFSDSREFKRFLPTFFKSRWAWAKPIKSLFSPSLAEGVRGWVKSQNLKDSHDSRNNIVIARERSDRSNPAKHLNHTIKRESKKSLDFVSLCSQLIFASQKPLRLSRHENSLRSFSRNDSIISSESRNLGESKKIFRLSPQNDNFILIYHALPNTVSHNNIILPDSRHFLIKVAL